MSIERYSQFNIPGVAQVAAGKGDMPVVQVRNAFADADIYLLGATISSFVPKGEKQVVWLGKKSPYYEGRALRGGVPVCFPWFGPHKANKDFPVHGPMRSRSWELESVSQQSDGRTRVVMVYESNEASRAMWPHDFRLHYVVTVGKALEIEMIASNPGNEPYMFENCLHTYFAVGDVAKTTVSGLDGCGYIDRLRGDARCVQSGAMSFTGAEHTKVVTNAPSRCVINDSVNKRRIVLEQANFKETIVWSIGEATAAKNAEIVEEWKDFVCVEAANCLDTRLHLLPGTSHRSWVRYGVEKA